MIYIERDKNGRVTSIEVDPFFGVAICIIVMAIAAAIVG
jgi:hypothetical protein